MAYHAPFTKLLCPLRTTCYERSLERGNLMQRNRRFSYEEESRLVTEFTNEVNFHMREKGMTRYEVAARMGISPARFSQILGGGENLNARTMASVTAALGVQAEITFRDVNCPGPVAPELFRRTAPRWNCVDMPNDGPHYTPGDNCLWCGKSRAEIAKEEI